MKRDDMSAVLGSCLRGAFAMFILSRSDQAMRASIDRLNLVTERVLADTTSRAAAIDDLTESR